MKLEIGDLRLQVGDLRLERMRGNEGRFLDSSR